MEEWSDAVLPSMQFGFDTSKIPPASVTNTKWRFQHAHIIGKPGMGKSTLLKRAVLQDIYRGDGVAFLTPHEEDIEDLLPYIPPERREDVILFAPADRHFAIGLNIFDRVPKEHKPQVVNGMVDIIQSLWPYQTPTPLIDQYFAATTAALLDLPDATLLSIYQMLVDEHYRKRVLSYSKDDFVKAFWSDFEDLAKKDKRFETSSSLNKIFRFAIDPTVRNIVGQRRSRVDFTQIMNERKILLVPLPEGHLGSKQASFLGALLLTRLHVTALTRTKTYRPPFHIHMDEFHRFVFGNTPEMFSGLRKFKVSLTGAHQFVDQLTPAMRKAILGTAGTLVSFALGPDDAALLSSSFELRKEGEPIKTLLTELKPFRAHVRTPQSIHYDVTFPDLAEEYDTYPPSPEYPSVLMELRDLSRKAYARQHKQVAAEIAARFKAAE